MKHAIKLLGVGLALVTAAIAQEDIKDKALLTGSGIDRANDWLVMGDASVTGTNPVLRRVKFSELVNISGMYSTLEPALGNPGTNGYVLSSTTSGTRSWVAPGGTWGSITGTLSSQTDLNTALAGKQASLGGVVLYGDYGQPQTFTPAANTAADRWAAFAAANTAVTADTGQIVECPPGNYLHPGTSFTLKSGTVYNFGTARFYLGANASTNVYLMNALTDGSRTKVVGGVFDNNGFTVSNGYGWFQANRHREFAAVGCKFVSTKAAWSLTVQGSLLPRSPSYRIENCTFTNSAGVQALQEMGEIVGCTFTSGESASVPAIAAYAGSTLIRRCQFVSNLLSDVVRFYDFSNDTHSMLESCLFGHNTGAMVKVDNNAKNGVTAVGCHFYGESPTEGWLDLGGAGFNATGCIVDCLVKASTTPQGNHYFNKCLRPSDSLVVTDAQLVSNLDAGKNAKIHFDMHSLSGPFAYNDAPRIPSFTVAGLPPAADSIYGTCAVTDATSPAVGSTVTGGGAVKALVTSNGSTWTVTAIP